VILAPFEFKHAEALLAENVNDDRNRPSFGTEMLEHFEQPDMAFTFIDHGHLIAIAGIQPLWPGVGEAWLLASDKLDAHKISVSRLCKRLMRQVADEQELHRVQAHMKSDWPQLSRWARFLGMEFEGTIRQMTPDREDYDMFSLVRKKWL
tara:strand:+ start:162 stop:611 length:450 start_codon:yes stop_codon:yes gene_type:complete